MAGSSSTVAWTVRAALARGDLESVRASVPAATMEYLESPEGLAVAARLAAPRAEAKPRSGGDR